MTVLWFTGLSGSGKSTLCERLYRHLRQQGQAVEWLDGDMLRRELSLQLGFSKEDRWKQIRIAAFLAKRFSANGILVLASFITPYEEMRVYCRSAIADYKEIYVKCQLKICAARDVKGLYALALTGQLNSFTGVTDPYEEPLHPDFTIDTGAASLDESIDWLLDWIRLLQLGE